METKIKEIQDILIEMLYIDFEVDETFPFIVSHPIFQYCAVNYIKDGEDVLIDITEASKEEYEEVLDFYENQIRNTDNINHLLMFVAKPYKSAFFKLIYELLSEEDYAEMLRTIWQECEQPNYKNKAISVPQFLKFFKKAKKEYLMTKSEMIAYDDIFEPLTVYRGYYSEKMYPALSWTTDRLVAEFFASRFSNGVVYKATIDKKYIVAMFDYENEVILDYKKLQNIEKIKRAD